ncbi:pF14018 domain protein [Clostridium sp. CAG:448]|nr:pF14018 domain protein [Clostridium sp. CAG:448]
MIPINKRVIWKSIILSLITFGAYLIYWEYLLIKNTRAIKKDESSCTAEMLCLIFVPFYSLYWWFTRGKSVKDEFAKHGYSANGNETAYLILALFQLDIVSMAILQNDFNSLPSEDIYSD